MWIDPVFDERHPAASKTDRPQILIAFEFRMQALIRLREQPEYKAWTLRVGKEGEPDFINEVLIETAAVQPLIERDEQPAFESSAFFQKALELAEAEGKA